MKEQIKLVFLNIFYYLKLINYKIVRTNSHNNDIKILYLKKKQIYKKVTNTLYGKNLLENELSGLKWFAKRIKFRLSDLVLNEKINVKNKDFYIDLKEHCGKKINYQKELYLTKKYIFRVIKFYKKIWPLKKRAPNHGDLTLDNIIFSNKKIFIIDWECFSKTGDFWGSDLVYLILSAVSLPNYKKGYIPEADQKILKNIWKRVKKLKINKELTEDPINYFKIKFKKKYWKNLLIRSPNKFYPMILKDSFIRQINSIIKN